MRARLRRRMECVVALWLAKRGWIVVPPGIFAFAAEVLRSDGQSAGDAETQALEEAREVAAAAWKRFESQ